MGVFNASLYSFVDSCLNSIATEKFHAFSIAFHYFDKFCKVWSLNIPHEKVKGQWAYITFLRSQGQEAVDSSSARLQSPGRVSFTPQYLPEQMIPYLWTSLSCGQSYEDTCMFLAIPSIRNSLLGLPWWRSCWESACQCRGHGFEPWSGKIPHAAEQLSPWATITEPARLEPVLRNKRGRDSERPAHRDEERPPLATTGESPRTETKTRHSPK